MNFRQQMIKKWITVLLTVILPGMIFLSVFAEDLFQVGENYRIEAPADIYLDYSAEYDLYYAIDSVTGSFIVLSPEEIDDSGYGENFLTEILEEGTFENETVKFIGEPQQGDGFRYRTIKRLDEGIWYDAIFAYYGNHLLRLTCVDGDAGVLTTLIQNTHTTAARAAADTGTETGEDTRVDIGTGTGMDAAELYTLALNAYLDEDYETAAEYAIPAADQGNTDACYLSGLLYYFGEGVEQSNEKSAEYMKLAADAGYAYAQENMGIFYYNGQGVEQSYEMAFWYFRLAADQGLASSQYNVGVMYYQGNGVDVDYEASVDYYILAAEQGHGSAQNNLGWMYSHGFGVERSYEKAVEYFRLAADQDQSTPQTNMAWMYEHGLGVGQSSSMAAEYYHKAAENLYEGCTVVIGAYEQNNDPGDGQEPIEWLVLEFDGDRVLLGAKFGLDTLPYHDSPDAVTWESSSLRAWLNGVFYEEAFSPTEKTGIQSASVPNTGNSVFGTSGGNETTDLVFLLSAEEIERFTFVNFESEATETAKANGAYVLENGRSFWWLRTPGITAMEASVVDENGAVSRLGHHINSTWVTVVPAMWVNLSDIQPAAQGGEQVSVTEPEPAPAVQVSAESQELYEQGLAAYEAEDYTAAMPYLKSAAEMGNPDAMLLMGNLYAFGLGVEKNGETASGYYLGAAEQGNAEAQFLLGEMYVAGFGVPKDQTMASSYYQQAADNGYETAYLKIASRYYYGTGVEQNYENAFHYYQLAAEAGKEDAYNMLGILYENGRGVEQSYENAIKYYRMAVEAGDEYGMHNLAYMYFYGRGVEQSYEDAFKYFQMSADLGKADDQYMTGLFYYNGWGTDQSYQMAFFYLSLASVQNDSDAQNLLGHMYLNGEGIEQSDETAFEYYQKSADQGNSYGLYSLAWMYYNGIYAERSFEKAFEYYKMAADKGMIDAQYNVGYFYMTGTGTEKSYEKAIEYYQMAAEAGSASAQNNLGYMFQHGLGVEKDFEKAFEYFTLAADQENITALQNLGYLYEYGQGIEQSEEMAIQYYQTVVENLRTGLDLGFGTYEQDNDPSNGPEPIEWFVVKIDGDRALMMARFGLDAQAFSSSGPNSAWDGSFMQSWLNNDFYNAAFTDLQKSRIWSPGESGDRIFLLSVEQAREIIESEILFMETEGTSYALAKGANVDSETGCSWYWLMTPGTEPGSLAYIDEYGHIITDGKSADISEGLVVPAFWLDLTALNR